MNKITWFKNYLQQTQDAITEIKRNRMVIDKSQLTKYLDDQSSASNFLLIGVLPDFSAKANTADDFRLVNTTQLMILKKTTYSEYNYDDFYGIFEETYAIVELVVKKMLNDSLQGCAEIRFLNPESIQIQPVWDESHCNGWKISFSLDMFL